MSAPARLPQAVVFDFDGIVLDTETPLFRAWVHVFELHECEPLTLEEWCVCVGAPDGLLDVPAILRSRARRAIDAEEVETIRRRLSRRLIAEERVLPGVESWLVECASHGVALGVASSSSSDWVEGHLERLGLAPHFRTVVCAGNGFPGKPAPDLYLEACRRLGADPARSLAIEDSVHGLTAAKRAGLACLVVPNQVTGGLDFSAADLRAQSLAELGLAQVVSTLGHRWG
jgi:HAD superfamily hydrolase (TIGR01509 family)